MSLEEAVIYAAETVGDPTLYPMIHIWANGDSMRQDLASFRLGNLCCLYAELMIALDQVDKPL
jgi:hypothetical protein